MSTIHASHLLTTSSSRGSRRFRCIASLTLAWCTALLLCHSVDLRADAPSPQSVLDRFLVRSAKRPPVEASSDKLNAKGWIEALTEFHPETGRRVRILGEGGAGRKRGALKGVLDAERGATLSGKGSHAALTAENYVFHPGPSGTDGLVAVRVTPRRRDAAFVDGTIFVTASDGDLVRVEGRLAKSPSFWTRSVDVVRHYARRAGQLPVEVHSLADVKVAGPTQFVMSYDYESVDGQTPRGRAEAPAGARRRHPMRSGAERNAWQVGNLEGV
jgi:hypothetical protein